MAMAMRKLSTISALLAASALVAMNGVAVADSDYAATGTLNINATVQEECLIGPATLAFGTFQSFAASATAASPTLRTVDASVAVPVACTNTVGGKIWVTTAAVTLSGTGANSQTLTANLSAVASGGTAFPTGATGGVDYTGTGVSTNVTVYGQVTTKTTTIADTYSGSTTMTITY
jgi:spore coat protein U-like protein